MSVEMEREAALIPVRRAVLEPRRPPWPSSVRAGRGRLRPADLPLGGTGDARPAH